MNILDIIGTKDFEIISNLPAESIIKKIREKTAVGEEYSDLSRPYQKFIYQGTFTENKIILNDFQAPGSGPAILLEVNQLAEYTLIKGTFDNKRYTEIHFFILTILLIFMVFINLFDKDINVKDSIIVITFFSIFTIILQNASTRKATRKCRKKIEKILMS